MTLQSKDSVEICDDLACVILNEMGQATADSILEIVHKLKKGCLNVVEEYFRIQPNYKWWVVTFDWDEEKADSCNEW